MHLDEERVQRLMHGELDRAGERLARQHLASCEDCRVLVDDAREEERRIFGLLREVDHPLPQVDPHAILPAAPRARPGWERWAAGLLLVAAAGGAAYAAPGSPLPAVLDRLIGRDAPQKAPDALEVPAGEVAPPGAGIAVTPGDGLTIRFLVDRDDAVATLSLSDGGEVMVRAVEGDASFTSDVDRLTVRSVGRVRFEILIPRSAPSVDVLVGETPVIRKRAGEILSGARPDPEGRYTLQLAPSPP